MSLKSIPKKDILDKALEYCVIWNTIRSISLKNLNESHTLVRIIENFYSDLPGKNNEYYDEGYIKNLV